MQIYYHLKSIIAGVSKESLRNKREKIVEIKTNSKNGNFSKFEEKDKIIQVFNMDSYYNKGIDRKINSS